MGDYRGATELNLAKLELYPGNPSYLAAALEAALRSADDDLIKDVLEDMTPGLKNGFAHEENLKTLLNGYFRDDLLVSLTNEYVLGATDDFAVALSRYLASLETNDHVLISSTAAAIIKDRPVNEDMLALVVMAAAQKLVPSLVDLYLPQLLAVAKRPLSVKALLAVAELKFMLGDAETATQLLEKAAVLTTDPIGLAITAATDSLLNPLLPVDLGETVLKIRDSKEGSNYHSEIKKLPTVFASSCLGLAKTESQVAACAEVLDSLQVRAGLLLLDGATRAMSLQKFDAAGYMIKQALTRETGAVFAGYVAYKVVDAIGDKYEVKDLEARKRLAQIALDANLKIDNVIDKDFDIYRRLLTEAVDSAETAFGSHQNPMISAWNASALNSRAYAMSMVGYNLKEALEIVQLAEKLGPEENGYYLETEAWIHFRMGDLKKALQLQLRAKPLWNRKMGSGVSESYGHLGEIYEASGKLKEAIDAYRTAVISSSDGEWKRRALRNWARLNHPN
jgi:tetratricopeptide (TPR) repeat protein